MSSEGSGTGVLGDTVTPRVQPARVVAGSRVAALRDFGIRLEALLAAQPDLIVSWGWDREVTAEATVGLPEEFLDQPDSGSGGSH